MRIPAGVEGVGHHRHLEHGHIAGEQAVQGLPDSRGGVFAFSVEVGHLANRVGARIGPPRAHGHDPISEQTLEGSRDLALD